MLSRSSLSASVAVSFFVLVVGGCGGGDGSSGGTVGGTGNARGGEGAGTVPSGAGGQAPALGGAGGGAGKTGSGGNGGAVVAAGGVTSVGKFEVPTMKIDVLGGAEVTSRDEYVGCNVSIDGKGSFSNYEGAASIRGRGNSTWLWYDKKPYRIKLNEKSEILGLAADKDWVLLANYRDPTFLMNAFAFAAADFMQLPFTNHSRFVEVTLNGSYIGLYQLTEQIRARHEPHRGRGHRWPPVVPRRG
ncbi:MAG: CotH kinase family protein [Polyangiaceae bacterium]